MIPSWILRPGSWSERGRLYGCILLGNMKTLPLVLLLLCPCPFMHADEDDSDEVEPCSFGAHTPLGTLSGNCTTQNITTPGFRWFWKLTLTFDPQSADRAARLQPDHFYDMFRAQS